MATADLSISNVLQEVKTKLQENGIKLWLAPYYVDGVGSCDAEIERLADDFSQILSVPANYCVAALTELQCTAVDKLRARDEFTKSGLATIKVKTPSAGSRLLTVNVRLNDMGQQLQDAIAKELDIDSNRVKLIAAGKVLNALLTLEDQNVKNNQTIMAVTLDALSPSSSTTECIYDRVQKARQDAELLMNQKSNFMEMEDQDGNAIHLPPEERRSLMMALALHEKGRAALNKDAYAEALVLFLEADGEYSTCTSQLLDTVDNYALLNLDIVWCYMCLKSFAQLPDAERRLHICEEKFKKSYGLTMDRVVAIKGSASNEKALIMRLHLLQSVLRYHQNRRTEAAAMLTVAEQELAALQVNDDSVAALMEMGYTAVEARVGLRACSGIVESAITHILERRETRQLARKRGREENRLQVGRSRDERWVNPRSLHVLMEMGFAKELCEVALRHADNDLPKTLKMLQEQPEQLRQLMQDDFLADTETVDAMKVMGFNEEMIKIALKASANDMSRAVEMMLKMQNDGTYSTVLAQLVDNFVDGAAAAAGPSSSGMSIAAAAANHLKSKADAELKAMEAFARFTEDISTEDDTHLDMPLVQEREILDEYKRFLSM